MTTNERVVRCRVAACRERLDDGNCWSLYLINDSDFTLDGAVLDTLSYEWGDASTEHEIGARVGALAPGAYALMHRDDGSGAELRMDVRITVELDSRTCRLSFEFPRLYRIRDFPIVAGLGKPGYEVAAVNSSA